MDSEKLADASSRCPLFLLLFYILVFHCILFNTFFLLLFKPSTLFFTSYFIPLLLFLSVARFKCWVVGLLGLSRALYGRQTLFLIGS